MNNFDYLPFKFSSTISSNKLTSINFFLNLISIRSSFIKILFFSCINNFGKKYFKSLSQLSAIS